MSWDTLAQVATSLGALLAAASLAAGFVMYRISRRDEYVAELRKALAGCRGALRGLQHLLRYDLVGEIVEGVVYSRNLAASLDDIYRRFYAPNAAEDLAALQAYLQTRFPVITVAVVSSLAERYEATLREIDAVTARYQVEYPGLTRVLRSTSTMLGNAVSRTKDMVRSEDLWKKVIAEGTYPHRAQMDAFPLFQAALAQFITGLALRNLEGAAKRIELLLALVDLVTDSYLGKSEGELIEAARRERSLQLTPVSQTKTITEDLREAEKVLRLVLTADETLQYRENLARIEEGAKA